MEKYNSQFEMEIHTTFKEPKKAEKQFLGEEFRSVFYKFDDLREVAQHIAIDIHDTPEQWDDKRKALTRFVEGFGDFILDSGKFILAPEYAKECGEIIVMYEAELDCIFTEEENEVSF